MLKQTPKDFSVAFPLPITFLVVQASSGVAQSIAAVIAAIATTGIVYIAAPVVWAPILRKVGFWWSSMLLGGAIVAVAFAAIIAGVKLGVPRRAWELPVSAALAGLLFSWALAAIRGAQDMKGPTISQSRYSPSAVFRPLPLRSRLRHWSR